MFNLPIYFFKKEKNHKKKLKLVTPKNKKRSHFQIFPQPIETKQFKTLRQPTNPWPKATTTTANQKKNPTKKSTTTAANQRPGHLDPFIQTL